MTFSLEHNAARAHLGLPGTPMRNAQPISFKLMRERNPCPNARGLARVVHDPTYKQRSDDVECMLPTISAVEAIE